MAQISKSLKKDERVGAVVKTKFKVETPAYPNKTSCPSWVMQNLQVQH
jgi:hypothetical protein